MLFYCAAITLTRDIIPHYRWRIAHATLPISGNYELDNGLVASVGFLCTLFREPVAGFEPATHGFRAIETLLLVSISGSTFLYVALPD